MSAEDKATGWPDGLMRVLAITWPKYKGVTLHTAEIALHEHSTGQAIHSAIGMVLTANVGNEPITAELTMLVGDDGLPLIGNDLRETCDETGEPRTGVFTWVVAEMRTAGDHAPPPLTLHDLTPDQLNQAKESIAAAMASQGVTVAGVGVDWIAPAAVDE